MKKKSAVSVGNLIAGGLLLLIGFHLLFSSVIISMVTGGFPLPTILVGGIMIFCGFRLMVKKKKAKAEKKIGGEKAKKLSPAGSRQREKASRNFSFDAGHHQHIAPSGLSTARRLEQLDTLYHAGLYTDDQYHAEKSRILAGK